MEAGGALDLVEPPALFEIGVNDLPKAWPMLAPLIEKACAHSGGDFTPKGVVDGMFEGRFQLQALVQGAEPLAVMVTSIERAPSGETILFVNLVGGRGMEDWTPFQPQLLEAARSYGCTRLRAIGRKGLTRKLPDWRLTGWIMEIDA